MENRVQDYIALDLEMTGLNVKCDRIIEIGAIRVERGIETVSFHTLVNPRCELGETVRELTGIRQEQVDQAPELVDIFDEFLSFCGELPLLGHRILFDYSFLKRAAVNQQRAFERCGIDTLTLCRRFMPQEEKKSLEAACAWFGIVQSAKHRALEDAKSASRLYERLAEEFWEQQPEAFLPKPLLFKIKREQPATKKQKEDLRYLLKYHKIALPVQIDSLSRNEVSRITDKVISQYGKIRK